MLFLCLVAKEVSNFKYLSTLSGYLNFALCCT